MHILTIRTDKPQAELSLYAQGTPLASYAWEAHRQLAETIHQKIQALLAEQKLQLQDLEGVVVYKGPGSFTGLRIGVSVANALADGLKIPIVGTIGDDWATAGAALLANGQNQRLVVPEYGAAPHITQQKR